MSHVRVVVAVAGVGLVLSGCGAANQTSAFIAKVNAACRATNVRLGALAPPASGDSGLAKLVREEIPIHEAELAKLSAFTAPSGERSAYKQAVADATSDVAAFGLVEVALRSNNRKEVASATAESSNVSAIARNAMTELHLSQCAKNL
jgi:hypothetical protein